MQLQSGSFLQKGKYRIESVLGQGGFGITYLAVQKIMVKGSIGELETEIKVAIKEFFMKDVCNRDSNTSYVSVPSIGSKEMVERFKQKFIKEAQNISLLKHPNIVKVLDIFEENGTAYYVMEYIPAGSLQQYISENGSLQEIEALHYIRQVADALDYIHSQHMNHLDVKPGNILRRNNADAVLIDFGLSKRYDIEGHQTSTTPVGISTGYAPMEQYKKGGVGTFSPTTDIYSLGATLYKLLTGKTPPDASDIFDNGLPTLPHTISLNVREAIQTAMEPKRSNRPQNVNTFLDILLSKASNLHTEETTIIPNNITIEKTIDNHTNSSYQKPTPFKRKRIILLGAVIFCTIIAIYSLSNGNNKNYSGSATITDSIRIADSIAAVEAAIAEATKTTNSITIENAINTSPNKISNTLKTELENNNSSQWVRKRFHDSLYEGYTVNGKRDGTGKCYYNNGNIYSGSWKNDRKNGQGTYKWADGSKYIGNWQNDQMHGRGTLFNSDGSIYFSGQWEYGVSVR